MISDIDEINPVNNNSLLMELIIKNYHTISYNLINKGCNVNYFNNNKSALTLLISNKFYIAYAFLCKLLIVKTNLQMLKVLIKEWKLFCYLFKFAYSIFNVCT